jgi:hypothetical protein
MCPNGGCPNEIGAQCSIRKSASRSTITREGPPISFDRPAKGAPHAPLQNSPVGPTPGLYLERDACAKYKRRIKALEEKVEK